MTETLYVDDNFTERLHCSKAREIVDPAAKLAVTVLVDLCRFPR